MRLSVLLVDDVAEVRVVLRQALNLRADFEIVAEAADGESAVEEASRCQPDVIVLDLGLPDLAGQDVLPKLRAVAPAAQVVVFTGSETPDRSTVRSKVEGYVTKDQEIGYLVDLLEGLRQEGPQSAVYRVGPDSAEVAGARRFVAERCRVWGVGELVEDATLVASELVTNALVHAGTGCDLRARMRDRVLRLEVVDAGHGTPDPRIATDADEHGRGLLLVSAVCAAWGVESLEGGQKRVWAELLRSD